MPRTPPRKICFVVVCKEKDKNEQEEGEATRVLLCMSWSRKAAISQEFEYLKLTILVRGIHINAALSVIIRCCIRKILGHYTYFYV